MKKLLSILAATLIATGYTRAQNQPANIANTLYASNFAQWTVSPGNNGPFSWSSSQVCTGATSGGATFKPFVVGSPIRIVDTASPGNSEDVIPSAVSITGSGCSITVTPAHTHFSFYLTTATGGLQEALNYSQQSFGVANPATTVLVTPAWSQLGGSTTTITVTAQGNAAISILDERTSVLVPYVWNAGTGHYVAQPFAGGACSDCVLTDPVGAQTINQSSGTLGVNSLNNVISIVPGTAITTLAQAITACGSNNTTIQITQTIAVGSGITVPANCTLLFQSAGNLTGTSITINGPIQSARRQIIGAGLAVTLGPLTTEVPIEWFGGKADATGSVGVGTDNLAPFNLANAALSAGCIQFGIGGYRFSGTPTIAKVNMCLEGQTVGYPATAASISANSSNLFIDSASADGPTFTSAAIWGIIRNLAVLRTQTPTGTAKGVSVNAGGVIVLNLSVQDSIYNIYFHGAGADGTGQITNNSVGWGLTGLAGTPSPASCGFFVDSSGAIPSASIKFLYDSATSNLSGAGTTTGLCASGTNLSDIYTLRFETAGTNFGIDLENTGTSNFVAQDIQLVDSVLNGCLTTCLKVNGAQSTTDIAPHVYVTGGNMFETGAGSVGASISNSTNVAIVGVQFLAGLTGSSAQTDIVLNTVDGFQVNDNDFSGASLINISCISCTHGTIIGNKIKTANVSTGATGIKLVASTLVSIQANAIAGNTPGNLLNGITFDAASSNNGPWSLNNIDAATVTTPVSDAGTNNNTLTPSVLTLAGGSAMNANQGNGAKVQHSTGSTTTNDCAKFDVNGNVIDAGLACGSGGSVSLTSSASTLTLTPSPITGTGTIDINLAHANTWSALQTFGTNFSVGGVTASGATGTGNVVFSSSPTLVTPALGTPSALVLTNATGSGAFNAETATNLASYPTLCTAGQFSLGLSSGSNNCSTPAGSGTVTHTAGALTLGNCVIGNASADIKVDPSCSTDGAGNMTLASVTANGATPGALIAGAGTGSIPALAANSFGFAGPVTGGTSYLFKPPATITAGILHVAAPGTGDGVNESALTSSLVSLTADVSGVLPVANGGSGASTFIIHGVLLGQTAGAFHVTAAGASNSVFMGQGAADPIWVAQPVIDCTNCTNLPSGGISGMTATQVAIAGSASTITSSKALAGAGTGVVTGPTTSVNNDVVSYNGTSGETKDSGILSSQVVTATAGYGSSILPKSNGGGIGLVASLYQDNGTFGLYNGTGGFSSPSLYSAAINYCPDTSGSGTAQSCSTNSGSGFTPVAGSCVVYTTTTTNSGAGLTLNVNSTSAKSIAIPGASGWTTTLTAGIILANKPMVTCYDGTNWNVQQTGTAASGGGATWNGITNPTGNLSLAMGTNTTTFTWNQTSGTNTDFLVTDTASNAATGVLFRVATAASSTEVPFQVDHQGSIGLKLLPGGDFLIATSTDCFNLVCANGTVQGTGIIGQGSNATNVINPITVSNNANGVGTGEGINFNANNSISTAKTWANEFAIITTNTSGSETGDLAWKTINAGTLAEKMRLTGAGDLNIELGHLTFAQTTPPAVTSCGGGTIGTNSTDNAFFVTGITAATSCTVTFNRALKIGVCSANTSTGIATGAPQSTTVAVFSMAALTGTLTAVCF